MATGRRRGRAIIYIVLILILVLVLVFAIFRLGPGLPGVTPGPTGNGGDAGVVESTATPIPEAVEIVVAGQEIKRGQEITDDRLAIVQIPSIDYEEGVYFQNREEVVGARALVDMRPGTPITEEVIVPIGGAAPQPSFEIPRGMVAISIPMSKLSSVSGALQKGDHVNLIASLLMVDLDTNWQSNLPNRTGYVLAPGPIESPDGVTITRVTQLNQMPPGYTADPGEVLSYMGRIEIDPTSGNPVWVVPSEPQRPRLVSQTLIQDVVILQLGGFSPAEEDALAAPELEATAAPGAAEGEAAEQPATNIPDVATVIVSPQDAVTLNYLMLSGATLNMVLRSAGDDQRIDTEAVTLQFILDQYRIPNPAKLPYGMEPGITEFPDAVLPFPDPGVAAPTPIP